MDTSEDERKRRKRKKYTPTHRARKVEISSLQDQIQELTTRLAQLQAEQPPTADDVQRVLEKRTILQSGLRASDLVLARTHSILQGQVAAHQRNPLERVIRLSADPIDRQRTLDDHFAKALDSATEFALERVRYLDCEQCHTHSRSFSTPEGDSVLIQCEVRAVLGVESVRQAYESVHLALLHREFQFSERLGVTTICDTDGIQDRPASLARYLSTIADSVDIEVNMAQFHRYVESSPYLDAPQGVIVVESVDEDVLYPYQPETRVRADISAVVLVFERPRAHSHVPDSIDVTVIRWSFTRLRHPQFPVPPEKKQELIDVYPRWGETLSKIIREYVDARRRCQR
ncbi:hypothetical protein Poli38472_014216 [Pythium oligandrum]|uniref:Uncharacterized protein n=1 Tax=Pythium oligandrum TaxID=41045 RepID=A0A8K1CJB6_PYTOL|nr:hypothetical protein Poli38472_014216 [Pythium oligandrum]|eukprot:TMW64099.1 hypothetical protein Poli38472_014216 [Pythium oligandrum]